MGYSETPESSAFLNRAESQARRSDPLMTLGPWAVGLHLHRSCSGLPWYRLVGHLLHACGGFHRLEFASYSAATKPAKGVLPL